MDSKLLLARVCQLLDNNYINYDPELWRISSGALDTSSTSTTPSPHPTSSSISITTLTTVICTLKYSNVYSSGVIHNADELSTYYTRNVTSTLVMHFLSAHHYPPISGIFSSRIIRDGELSGNRDDFIDCYNTTRHDSSINWINVYNAITGFTAASGATITSQYGSIKITG